MEKVLKGTGEAIAEAMTATGTMTNDSKKVKCLREHFVNQTENDVLTSETGVRQPTHDNWLSASTKDRQGPALLEDNFAREKVRMMDVNG